MPALLRYSKWRPRPERALVVGRFYIHGKLVKHAIATLEEAAYRPDGTEIPGEAIARRRAKLLSKRWEAKMDALRRDMPAPAPKGGKLFSEAAGEFLFSQRQVRRAGTVRLQEKTVQRFRKIVGNLPLAAIDRHAVETFRGGLLTSGLKPVTTNLELRNLRSMLNWCLRAGLLPAVPYVEMVGHTKASVRPAPPQRVRAVWDQIALARGQPRPAYGRGKTGGAEIARHIRSQRRAQCHARLIFNLSLGMRRSEAAYRLQADYLVDDLADAWVLVRDNTYMQVKQAENQRYPLTPEQALWVTGELARTPTWEWFCQGYDRQPRPLWSTGNAVSQTLRRYYGIGAAQIRKAVATGTLAAGADPLAVSALLGHSQLRTTDNHYMQSRDPLKRRASALSPFGTMVEPKENRA